MTKENQEKFQCPECNSKNIRFNTLFDEGIKKIRSTIDPLVTSDTSRIFRLPNSLHEKSGLCKTLCNSIDSFDPYTQSVVLDNEPIKIDINFFVLINVRLNISCKNFCFFF